MHLLVYAVQTGVTTGACLVEIFASEVVTWEEKVRLGWLYGVFAVVPGLMGVDMFLRIRRKLLLDDGCSCGKKVAAAAPVVKRD